MRVAVFSTKPYDQRFFEAANLGRHQLHFLAAALDHDSVAQAAGCGAACIFANDQADAEVLEALVRGGTRVLALRSAGFDQVDLVAAGRLGMTVVRVPAYSPHAIAEHAVGLLLMLDRKLHLAYSRVREGNFSLDGLMGFDLRGKTIGIVGTGSIGTVMTGIMIGFGCRVIASDPHPDPVLAADLRLRGVRYLPLDDLLGGCDVVSLHLPLSADNRHLLDARTLALMRPGAMLINTSRGGLLDTGAAIAALTSGQLGALGLDVYEGESGLFYEDRSAAPIPDERFARLLAFPNVVVTGHQAFLTREALTTIAETTLANLSLAEHGLSCANTVHA